MVENFLALHVTSNCQLRCKHCYCRNHTPSSNEIPLDFTKNLCEDFLNTDFPLPESTVILSGGEPLLHPDFVEACDIVRKLNGKGGNIFTRRLYSEWVHSSNIRAKCPS